MQNRFKSKALWVGVMSALWLALEAFGVPQKWGLERTAVFNLIDAICAVLAPFGVLNNPTDSENF